MKQTIRFGLLAVLLLTSSLKADAGNGIKRNSWDCGPEISMSNIYTILLGEGLTLLYGEERPLWAPTFIYKTHISPSMVFSTGTYDRIEKRTVGMLSGKTKAPGFFDLDLKNYSVGYVVNYMSKEFPIGFSAKLAYEQTGFDAEMNNEDGVIGNAEYRKQMIVPEMIMRIRIGNYRKSSTLICLDLGGCYEYAVGAKSWKYSGTETVNSGLVGIIGFNIADPVLHFQCGANYTIPSFNYFNREYTPDGGVTFPLKNKWWSSSSALSVYIRLGF